MKNVYVLVTILAIALSFNACSGGGDSASFEDSSDTKIIIGVCPATTVYADGDTLTGETPTTTVKITNLADGTKTVCSLSGSAYLTK